MATQRFLDFIRSQTVEQSFKIVTEVKEETKPALLAEAINTAQLDTVSKLISTYLSRKVGVPFFHYPEVEHYKNAKETGFGVRFFFGLKSIRFNWKDASINSAALKSIDVWVGKGPAIDYHIEFDTQISLVKTLPIVAEFLQNPKLGVFEYNTETALHEFITDSGETSFLAESVSMIRESDDPQYDQVISLFKNGSPVEIQNLKGASYQIYLAIRKAYPEYFEKSGRAVVFNGDTGFFVKNQAAVSEKIGRVKARVTKGAAVETYVPSNPKVEEIEQNEDRVKYEIQLRDLSDLTHLVATGASNALFVAGRGGIGKTHTVEEALSGMGLQDGQGYFKNTGTASPVGIYILLYENRNGIILFDDADGALADQDGRNLIKAATDTKKVRKLAWTKKSSTFVDPADYNEDDPEPGTYPKYFDFKGRVIFISNLPINKLDPDGALRTRALMIDINPTDMELVDFMKKLAPTFPLAEGMQLSVKERLEVVDLFVNAKSKSGLSLRKLERGLNIRASLGDNSNWQHIIKNYA
jgi:hypothetical protein